MVYKYLYQTRDNENKSGEIKARNRAEAYAAIRKLGIKPYRVIGEDPGWLRLNWPYVAGAAAVSAFLIVSIALMFARIDAKEVRQWSRRQLAGDMQVIAKGVAEGWPGVFDTALDRHLAAYAQPGWRLEPPELSPEDVERFPDDLAKPFLPVAKDAPDEIRQLKNIVAKMREEMKEYLEAGGTVEDYLEFLRERQDREAALREKAYETLDRAPASMRERALLNLNIRLRDMGIAPIGGGN